MEKYYIHSKLSGMLSSMLIIYVIDMSNSMPMCSKVAVQMKDVVVN